MPDGRFPATLPAASGANLTALNASNLASGTVADARLSENVPLKNASNEFTGASQLINNNSSTWGLRNAAGAMQAYMQAIAADKVYLVVEVNLPLGMYTNNTERLTISNGGNFDFKAGTVTTNNASASEVGFKGVPVAQPSGDYTLVLSDAGKYIQLTENLQDVTIPSNASVAFPIGTVITIEAAHNSVHTISITDDTLYLAGTAFATTGTRTLAYGGVATLMKRTATTWFINGPGVT